MSEPGSELAPRARAHIASLYSISVLSLMMLDRRDEEQILGLARSSAPGLAWCHSVAIYHRKDGSLRLHSGQLSESTNGLDVHVQLAELGGEQGVVRVTGTALAMAYPLRALGDHHGYLVLTMDHQPTALGHFLISMLAQHTGAALANAAVRRSDRAQSAHLAELTTQLRTKVTELRDRQRIHDMLTRASATGCGEDGIADAVNRLTGLPVGIQDRFGHLRKWTGLQPESAEPPMPADRQTDLLNRARRHPGPIRDGDRLVAIAQAHGEVLGALVLLDPLNAAGEHARLALEDGATMLALELVHQQNLAEVELRLRRDLIDDLLGGTADASVFARARSLGHDLNLPHRVIVVSCNKQSDELVLQAVQRATSTLSMGCLLTHKPGLVVLLVRNPGAWDGQRPWDRLHTAIKREMRSAQGAVGVGGNASDPSDLARSYQEAQQALAIRQRSRDPDGVTVFEDLGIYRLLSSDAPFEEADRFVKEWLGSLVDYDERHNSELVRTLSLYLEHGGNYDCTASALQIHRSTLRYRLQRIRDISCRDLTDPHNRLNLHLATQAWHILQGTA